MFNSRMSKLFIVVVIALIFATSAYAFAASNTVPGTVAGEGAGWAKVWVAFGAELRETRLP